MMGLILTLIAFFGYNARGIGLAGALTGEDAGPQSGYYNPAMLSYSKARGTCFNFLYAGIFAGNSAFSVKDVNNYFQEGKVLNFYDKRHLLYQIGLKSLNIVGRGEVAIFGFKTSGFAIALEGFVDIDANIHREIFDLILNGNQLGKTYQFKNLTNYGTAYVALDLAFSKSFNTMQLDPLRKFFFGIGLKAIRGIAYANVDRLNLTLSVDTNYIYLDGNGRILASMGGSGMGVDVGIGFETEKWSFGLSLLNLGAKIRWTDADSAILFVAHSDSFTVGDLIDNPDTIITDSSWSEPVEPFYSKLPTEFRIGLGRRIFHDKIRFFGDFSYSSGDLYSEKKLGLATELRYIPFLPVRFGVAITNRGNFYTTGMGLRLFKLSMDAGVAFYRGIFESTKGIRAGIDIGINLP